MKRRVTFDLAGDSSDSEDESAYPLVHDESYSYVVESTGASVSLVNAKSLLYQYCSRLPSDQ